MSGIIHSSFLCMHNHTHTDNTDVITGAAELQGRFSSHSVHCRSA